MPLLKYRLLTRRAAAGRVSDPSSQGYSLADNNNNTESPILATNESHEVQEQVVTFEEDGSRACCSVLPCPVQDIKLDAATDDTLENDVVGILERPVLIGTKLWKADVPQLGRLFEFDLPSSWTDDPMMMEKLSGFRYFKCDFEILVLVNGQPFNAGILLTNVIPFYKQINRTASNLRHLGGLTGFPHAKLNIANDTTSTHMYPFQGPVTWNDRTKRLGNFGTCFISVLSPLTGSADVEVSVWVVAKRVRVSVPTGVPAGLPSGTVQGGEEERKRPGNIETAARAAGTIFQGLSGIPSLMGFSTAGTFVSEALAGMASAFGWAKPRDPEYPGLMQTMFGRYLTNYNGDTKVKTFGFDVRNSVAQHPESAAVCDDEMAMATIANRFTFLDQFKFKSDDVTGKRLWSAPCCPTYRRTAPSSLQTAAGAEDLLLSYDTMLSYVSRLFLGWRGSLRYKFIVAKTPFHSGRVRISYVPAMETSDQKFIRTYNYQKIVDLRNETEFEFEVPFLCATPFRWFNEISTPAQAYNQPLGSIVVEVLNTLRNPPTCANDIHILVEVAGGSDFQLVNPRFRNRGLGFVSGDQIPLVPPTLQGTVQSGEIAVKSRPTYQLNKYGIGEVIPSLRNVLKRSYKFAVDGNHIRPFGLAAGAYDIGKQVLDPYTYIRQLFLYRIGSVNLTLIPKVGTVPFYTLLTGRLQDATVVRDSQEVGDITVAPQAYFFPAKECTCEVHVPMYSHTPITLGGFGSMESFKPGSKDYEWKMCDAGLSCRVYSCGVHTDAVLNTDNFSVLRCIGEDFSFLGLIGPPITFVHTPMVPPSQSNP